MDQVKIGRFIQTSRKQINMTQRELADKLGVSDKLISKWETGNGMPDISIINDVCNVLNVSVNELLSGESLPPEKYSEKAEENIMELLKDNNNNKKSYVVQIIMGSIILLVTILLLALTTYGAVPSLVFAYLDFASLVAVTAIGIACVLISGAKNGRDIVSVVRKTIVYVGLTATVFKFVGLCGAVTTTDIVIKEVGAAFLPLLYSLGLFLVFSLAEIRIKNR